jgi:hypothetical protein
MKERRHTFSKDILGCIEFENKIGIICMKVLRRHTFSKDILGCIEFENKLTYNLYERRKAHIQQRHSRLHLI